MPRLLPLTLSCALTGCPGEPRERHRSCQRWERNNARSEHPVTVCDPGGAHRVRIETPDGEFASHLTPGQKARVAAFVENLGTAPLETTACAPRMEIRGSWGVTLAEQPCGDDPVTLTPGEWVQAGTTHFNAGVRGDRTIVAIADFDGTEPCSACTEVAVSGPTRWTCAGYWQEYPPGPGWAPPCPTDGDVGYEAHLVDREETPIDTTARGRGAAVQAWIANRGAEPLVLMGCDANEINVISPTAGASEMRDCLRRRHEVAPGERHLAGVFPIDTLVQGTGGTVGVVRFSGPTSCAVCTEWTMTE